MSRGLSNFKNSRSNSEHLFSLVPQVSLPRSKFSRDHQYKTTIDAGFLVPVLVDEVYPGDTFTLTMTAFVRFATLIFPIMDNLYVESFFFFVPNRLVWEHWEQFCGWQQSVGDSTDYVTPKLGTNTHSWGLYDLADYFGYPTQITYISNPICAFGFRSYNLIWNEWFRDQNLQDALNVSLDDGPDDITNYAVQQRGKRHDYFTSCLPWPQKINDGTVVELPLGTSAPIVRVDSAAGWTAYQATTDTPGVLGATQIAGVAGSFRDFSGTGLSFDPNSGLIADLSSAASASINAIRQAFQLQRYFEKDARGGTRYPEKIKAHFGVTSPDARLQRPEYLGGGFSPVLIQAVPNTTGASGENPQAALSGYGVAAGSSHGFSKSFVEHGTLIGLICVRADLTYQQGLDRQWTRSTVYDFYWPSFAQLGEQAVLLQEIYFQGASGDSTVFGYQERYAELRYKRSMVTGQFRSNASGGTYDKWHLAQNFVTPPTLNSNFIVEQPPTARVKATSDDPDFFVDTFFKYNCTRVLPLYGVPGNIDRL